MCNSSFNEHILNVNDIKCREYKNERGAVLILAELFLFTDGGLEPCILLDSYLTATTKYLRKINVKGEGLAFAHSSRECIPSWPGRHDSGGRRQLSSCPHL